MAISCGSKGSYNSSKHDILFFLIILLSSSRACCDDHPHASKRNNCLESERRALLAVKSDLYNSEHWLSSWNGYDCCKWRGVVCDNTTNHVIRLDLHYPLDQYASSPNKSIVSPSLFELKHLKYLNLSSNNFSTHMPSMISSLVHLEHLDLSYANFNGLIPQQLGNLSNLRFLNLGGYCYWDSPPLWSNDLSWLSRLTSLEYLDMSCVNLSTTTNWPQDAIGGNISMNVTRKLKHLGLASTSLTKVPLNMGSLFHLEYLDLSGNYITDMILLSTVNLSCLEYLDLYGNDITGEIPLSISNFINLKYLDLSGNDITGEIPLSIGNLSSLLHFDASRNNLMGSIPLSLGDLCNLEVLHLSFNNIGGELTNLLDGLSKCPQGSKLQDLRIYDNKLNGSIPSNLGQLAQLQYLDISSNSLQGLYGNIPGNLGDLCNLEVLDLSGNNIGGELTNLVDGLSKCPQGSKLQSLFIYDNKLNGSIPSNLGQLAQLQFLDISSNSLQGNMTDAHFSKLTNLTSLDISYNSLNLILSDDWLPPFRAESIDMSYCHLGTRIPSWIQTQTTLEELYLSGVGLHGNIPGWFSDFIFNNSLFRLDMSSNNLNGQIPSRLPAFTDLSNNSFEGTIPLSYANFENVRVLKLSDNHIYGSLPAFFCNLTHLNVLQLSNNYLLGEIPNYHGSYPTSLQSLHMNNNNLSGPFPPALRNSTELIVLDLGGNKFSGEIPKWVGRSFPMLSILSLSSNSFHGAIPVSIGNLALLQILDFSSNKLTSSIPSTIVNFTSMRVKQNYSMLFYGRRIFYGCRSCAYYSNGGIFYILDDSIIITAKGSTNEYTTTLRGVASIDLSNNEFSGEIPKEITKLHGLYFLNLSNNYLTGRIPENISAITELESLDLSMNRLTGEIPSNLSSLTFLSFLNLSYNNLSGRIPTGRQFSTFNESIYVGNKGLCGMPLPECPGDEANHSPSQIGENEDGDKLETVLNYTFIVMGFIAGFWAYFGTIIMKKSIKVALVRMADKMYDWIYVQLSLKIAKLKLKWQK